ncbi:MAG: DUF4469 domain-containing protein [Treponema sp.]|nr:DUF4469 domain-containing protein [Treponema sp.]
MDAADILENQNIHLLIVVPTLPAGTYRLEVTTRFAGNGKPLKAPASRPSTACSRCPRLTVRPVYVRRCVRCTSDGTSGVRQTVRQQYA